MSASPLAIRETQADGSPIDLNIRGNAKFHWLEDKEGYTVVQNGRSFVYAQLNAAGRLAPTGLQVGRANPRAAGLQARTLPSPAVIEQMEMERQAGASPPAPISAVSPAGAIKNIVILMMFSDHTGRTLPSNSDFNTIFNAVGGDPTLAPTGSVKDFYTENSYGTMTLNSTVYGWVTLPNSEAYYANGESGLGTKIHEAITAALNLADGLIDFSQFDADGNGFVDSIAFVHSGYAAEFGGTDAFGTPYTNRIWSHRWAISTWTSAEGIKVKDYHINPGLWSTSGTAPGRIGVICHETGHFFGLPDLYDSSGGEGIGSYCLMANSWGFTQNQLNPPHFSAWSKIFLGWTTPTLLSTTGPYSLARAETSAVAYKITQGYPSGEYLLVENRQPYGFESTMPQGGLAIWHIDENKSDNTDEGYPGQAGWPGNNKHYRVALMQADGLYNLEKGTNRGDGGDVYHGAGVSEISHSTSPSTDAYQGGTTINTANRIYGISTAGSTMTFSYAADPLSIVASGLSASGLSGGPFSPSSGTYTLTNLSGTSQNWSASATQPWLTVSPTNGTLAGGGGTVITASINSAANSLSVGSYSDTVTITNTTSGVAQTFTVSLTVGSPHATLFDSYTDATWTSTGSTPRSFMGAPITLGNASGTSNIAVAGGTAYLASTAAVSYTNIRLNITVWGALSGGSPAFSSLLGSFSFDLGPLNAAAGAFYPYTFTLPTPVTFPTQTGAITVNWQGDSGAGLVSTDNLTSLLRYGPALAAGTAGGFYRNASGETDGNFLNTSARTFGLTNESLALQLLSSPVAPMALTNAATNVGPFVATLNASVNPGGTTSIASFQYGATTGYGSTSTITLSPNNGSSAQSVTASLAGLSPSTLYHFRVTANNTYGTTTGRDLTFTTPANTLPIISGAVAGQAVNDNATLSPLSSVTISDADSPAQTLAVSVTLDTAAKGSFTTLSGFTNAGSGVYTFNGAAAAATAAIRGLVFTPTANRVPAGATETTTLTISVNDSAGPVTNSTTTVVATSMNDFTTWAQGKFTALELADSSVSGPNAIFGQDGLSNLIKYALGLEPKTNTTSGLPAVSVVDSEWVFTYVRPASITDVTYAVEVSTDLVAWTTAGVTHEPVSVSGGNATWRGRYPLNSATNVFFRLSVTQN